MRVPLGFPLGEVNPRSVGTGVLDGPSLPYGTGYPLFFPRENNESRGFRRGDLWSPAGVQRTPLRNGVPVGIPSAGPRREQAPALRNRVLDIFPSKAPCRQVYLIFFPSGVDKIAFICYNILNRIRVNSNLKDTNSGMMHSILPGRYESITKPIARLQETCLVRFLLQAGYKRATSGLQAGYKGAISGLQGCYKGANSLN